MIFKSSICGAYRRCIHKGWCIRRVMAATICALCGKEYNKRSIDTEKYCNCYNANQVLVVEIVDEHNGTVYQEYEE